MLNDFTVPTAPDVPMFCARHPGIYQQTIFILRGTISQPSTRAGDAVVKS
jgi:hypothetical protein